MPAASSYESSLRSSLRDARATAFMMGIGEGYLSAFAVFLQASPFYLGVLATAPAFVGSLGQLGMVHLGDRVLQRKPLVVVPAFLQALLWLLVFLLPFTSDNDPRMLLVAAIPCVALGSAMQPFWYSWIGDLLDPEHRGDFFGRRGRIRTILQVSGLVAGGGILSLAGLLGHEEMGFATVFSLACGARLLSYGHLKSMEEPPYSPTRGGRAITLLKFLRRAQMMNFGRFTLYVAALQFAMSIAGPFFALFMLRDLRLSYAQFTAAAVAGMLMQAVTMHNWGIVADRFGNRRILALTGGIIPILPLFWMVSPTFAGVLFVQAISGVVRAGFDLSTATFVLDSVVPALRARSVAYHTIIVNIGSFAGAMLGGWIGVHLPESGSIMGVRLVSNLYVLFILSTLVRLLVTVRLLPLIHEVRPVAETSAWNLMVQVVGLTGVRGLNVWPIVMSHGPGGPLPSVGEPEGEEPAVEAGVPPAVPTGGAPD